MTALLASDRPRLFDRISDEDASRRSSPTRPAPNPGQGTADDEAQPHTHGPRGEPTLDQLIVNAWEGLTARLAVVCPICDSQMLPEYGVHGQPLGGRCTRCGSTLT